MKMESKEIRGLMEAYASIYEGYGKDKKKKKMHDCATHGEHSEWGAGVMIKEMHTLDEDGNVTHYDVMFEHGIEKNVPVEELNITMSEKHEHFINYDKNAEVLDEAGLPYGPVGRGFKKLPPGKKRTAMMDRADALRKKAMSPSPDRADIGDGGRGSDREKMGNINAALTNPRLREETDLFDYILEHLVAEGYADTNKAALAIMANMSEEWRQSIVEETRRTEYLQNKFNKENERKSGSAHTEIPGKQNTGKALQKARESERHMRGEN